MKVSVLTDNMVRRRGLVAEHGLSLFIEQEGRTILFDTGQSSVYIKNAGVMGIDLGKTDTLVLSHGHYDHCGGLAYFPDALPMPPIYIHPDALLGHYIDSGAHGGYRDIGIPWSSENCTEIKSRLILCSKEMEIAEGIHLVSEIPSVTDFEAIPASFYTNIDGTLAKDTFRDEQMLVWETSKGLSVFLGCSHPGIINCMLRVKKLFPGKQIVSLLAGMHLENCDPQRLDITIRHLADMDIPRILPLHCTGIRAICEMENRLGDRCHALCTGDEVEL